LSIFLRETSCRLICLRETCCILLLSSWNTILADFHSWNLLNVDYFFNILNVSWFMFSRNLLYFHLFFMKLVTCRVFPYWNLHIVFFSRNWSCSWNFLRATFRSWNLIYIDFFLRETCCRLFILSWKFIYHNSFLHEACCTSVFCSWNLIQNEIFFVKLVACWDFFVKHDSCWFLRKTWCLLIFVLLEICTLFSSRLETTFFTEHVAC